MVVTAEKGDAPGVRWVETRDAVKYCTMHGCPAAKKDPVERAQSEKSWPGLVQKFIVSSDHTQQMAGVSPGETLASL